MAQDASLTRTQKNTILQLIVEAGIPPTDFDWIEEDRGELCLTRNGFETLPFYVSVLSHKTTKYYFNFGHEKIVLSPGSKSKVETRAIDDWFEKQQECRRWLLRVHKEANAPDLWAVIGRETALARAASSSLENRRFTVDEIKLISAGLEEIRAYLIQSQNFAQEQRNYIEQQFQYFRQACDRVGRKDWLNLVLGGLLGLAIELALDPEKAGSLIRVAGSALQFLWTGVRHLLS
jgi:hypothetical protein